MNIVDSITDRYDYLVVGAGLFGAVFARVATDNGKKCLVIDKRDHIGGNCYTENIDGINVHKYGPHIFHTSDIGIWQFMKQFADFNNYVHRIKVIHKGKIYSFPINLLTFNQVCEDIVSPDDAKQYLDRHRLVAHDDIDTIRDWSLSNVGMDLYLTFIKHYTVKQWGRAPQNLPASIIKRIPVRYNFDDRYYTDTYQGIPIGGYTRLFESMLLGVNVKLSTDFLSDRYELSKCADRIVFTGRIDEFYDFLHGVLQYRSLKFLDRQFSGTYQGCAQINYTDDSSVFTRSTEHKYFEDIDVANTIVTYEEPFECDKSDIPYYSINDNYNNKIFNLYADRAISDDVIFGGRLAEYKYLNMDQVVRSAIDKAMECVDAD